MKEAAKSILRFLRRLVSGKETNAPSSAVSRFTYGWFCPKCKHVTEHKIVYREQQRCLVCQECGLSTYFPVRSPLATLPMQEEAVASS